MSAMTEGWNSSYDNTSRAIAPQGYRSSLPGSVRLAQINDIFAIAHLHRKFIADTLLSSQEQPGLDFVVFYYHTLISRADSAVYVACYEKQVIGYASAVKNHGQVLRDMLLTNPVLLIKIFMKHRMLQRHFIRYVMAKFFNENLGGKWPVNMDGLKNAGELRSVVVEPEYRGLSVGRALLKASIGFAGQNNWGSLIAWIAESNLSSRRLFERAGFSKMFEKFEAHGKVYIYASQCS